MTGTKLSLSGKLCAVLICVIALIGNAARVRAVIFKSTGDPSYNTNAPTGSLTNSGWQYEGAWVGYVATPIAPRYFIAAKHVNGATNYVFKLDGFEYQVVTNYPDPNSDLQIWRVAQTIPRYASLYTNTDEVGKHCVVFGRGTQRGGPVIVSGKTNGWYWGTGDGVQRWGENDVTNLASGGPGFGSLLRCAFDQGANSNECHISVGDSSGGLFIQDGSTWKLAGIHSTVDGPFSLDGTGNTETNAALMDARGLYFTTNNGTSWILIPTNNPTAIPSRFYSTRISANIAWINSVIDFLPGDDLRITAIQQVGDDISISFATTNRLYYLQRIDDLSSGTWTTFTNNVMGTGGIVSILDTNAATLPQRFYRVGLE